jgi:hypothetical protein
MNAANMDLLRKGFAQKKVSGYAGPGFFLWILKEFG